MTKSIETYTDTVSRDFDNSVSKVKNIFCLIDADLPRLAVIDTSPHFFRTIFFRCFAHQPHYLSKIKGCPSLVHFIH